MLTLCDLFATQVDVSAMEARHASQLAALQGELAAAQEQQEIAVSRLQKEQEAERERVKRAIAELKKKLDRHDHQGARSHQRGLTEIIVLVFSSSKYLLGALSTSDSQKALQVPFTAALQAQVHHEEAY